MTEYVTSVRRPAGGGAIPSRVEPLRDDPLALWRRAAREGSASEALVDPDATASRAAFARLDRYFVAHARRGTLPAFERDALRQADLSALGLGAVPVVTRWPREARACAAAVLERLYGTGAPPDEPWIERHALCALGYVRDEPRHALWEAILHRAGVGDTFAGERRMWALAALAWRAGLGCDAESERVLREATAHRRADVRATACAYLLAAHRLGARVPSMETVSALFRLAQHDPQAAPRVVARAMLAADRIELAPDPEELVFELSLSSVDPARESLGEAALRSVQTLAHLDALVCGARRAVLAQGGALDEHFSVEVEGALGGARFDLCHAAGRGVRPGEVALATVGLRAGDTLTHVRAGRETRVLVRATRWVAMDDAVPWVGAAAAFTVFEGPVSGTRFHRASEIMDSVTAGQRVELAREPGNPHDDRAIEVRIAGGDKLGYVPRAKNRYLARLMDTGERVSAAVIHAAVEGDIPVIFIRVRAMPSGV